MATRDMCVYCFDVLVGHFEKMDCPDPTFQDGNHPLFVTWLKESKAGNKDLSLRGCIGSLSPLMTHSGLKNYALTSAFKDRRFSPISVTEVPRLHCAVTLLTDFEDCSHYLDWQIGVHGLVVEFTDSKGRSYSSTYLPDICPEQGWTQHECIESLIRKAGYNDHVTEDLRRCLRVTRYQGTKSSISYAEYAKASNFHTSHARPLALAQGN
eukprot:CAMPEP_0196658614 /NCGR_PEP_ID=MMETSP1086-20130531/30570_1 /TAXON_ID=77921 /ORGANISM="Cyanoptyche  gloeocystis , Strain SAG4.97" /LENGTH=209 /DNA_ID=CAMNT_0041992257 /DNA_START=92 /DNA_END=721 /DNA_ORIENTATION=-